MSSTAPTCRSTWPRDRPTPPPPIAAISAAIRRRWPMRRSWSRSGWRGSFFLTLPWRALEGEGRLASRSDASRGGVIPPPKDRPTGETVTPPPLISFASTLPLQGPPWEGEETDASLKQAALIDRLGDPLRRSHLGFAWLGLIGRRGPGRRPIRIRRDA